ncbi:hypothetical protein ACIO87_33325 [Streptomyces sp. NPDC087218]
MIHSDRGSEYTSTQFQERIGELCLSAVPHISLAITLASADLD